jgi:hypothetical protein
MKARLYIDIDDTVIANCHTGSGFDLRPGVMTQLRGLSRLFDCFFLTMWPRKELYLLIKLLYGAHLSQNLLYAEWPQGHPQRKAGYVLGERKTQNFWWLEDPLTDEEIKALTEAGKLDRYVRVEPYGPWGFLDAVNELFRRAGIDKNGLKRVGIKPEWFNREAILNQESEKENTRQLLTMVQMFAQAESLTPEEKVKRIEEFVGTQLITRYE